MNKDLFDHLITAAEWSRTNAASRELTNGPLFGPSFKDPENTWVDERAEIGQDTLIFPGCYILGPCKIGKNCVIFPNTVVVNIIALDNVVLGLPTMKNSAIGEGCVIGATAELNRTFLCDGVKMVHHSYLGDAHVGKKSNIGAGTITANYDGKNKNKTILGPGTFTGVHTSIIAPNEFPEGTYIAAGSTIPANIKEVRHIPPFSLIISRAKEIVIKMRKGLSK